MRPIAARTTEVEQSDAPAHVEASGGVIAALIETTKPGITRLVTVTSLVGFALAAAEQSWSLGGLVLTAAVCGLGTALAAAGANSINQWMERERDGLMPRTEHRPLPSGRVSPDLVLRVGVGLGLAGTVALLTLGWIPALIALTCIVSYVACYTPLKPRTTLSTFIGAIPGALPPLIGWTAAAGPVTLERFAWSGGAALFVLMFIWQIPHFMAIAWMYREDYAKGGYAVLPVVDPRGVWTAATVGMWTTALVPAVVMPAVVEPTLLGPVYLAVAGVTSAGLVVLAARLMWLRTRGAARALFFGTIIQLPLLLMTMVGEIVVRTVS